MVPPLALDIDGTLTTGEGAIDPRAFEVLPGWDAPVVLVTGKSFPYPIALCHFMGVPEVVVAENGGVVCDGESVTYTGDRERAEAVVEAFVDRGGEVGWGGANLVNRWRETEVAVSHDADGALLREVAAEFEMEVYDTGYAFHVKTPGVEKGTGLVALAESMGLDPSSFVAVGDSENDATTFGVVGRSFAVANADDVAMGAADEVTEASYMDGTLEVLSSL
ncbi:MAG: phosphoglycolate phosphatase [Salinigranum sp.]